MSRIAILGARGQLGVDLAAALRARGETPLELNRPELEVTEAAALWAALDQARPAIVLNTTAAHGARQESAADQRAFFDINALGVWHLARWCASRDATLVHYSTDYVFGAAADRARPYTEADTPCPTNLYGASKLAGEQLVSAFCPRHYVLRIASVYGRTGSRAKNNSNFVKLVLGKLRAGEPMKVVDDQVMSPTWTAAAAEKTLDLLAAAAPYGLYHLAGSGACTWYALAREIVRQAGGTLDIEPTTTPADKPDDLFRRPRYTALDNARLRSVGLADLPPWPESLGRFLQTEQSGQ